MHCKFKHLVNIVVGPTMGDGFNMIKQRNKTKQTIIHIQKVQQIMCHNPIQFTMEEFGNATFKL